MAVVLSASEFIVGLQIVWTDIECLGLRMMAEIEFELCRTSLASQQESYRRGAWGIPFQGFGDGPTQRGSAVLVE